MRQEAGLAGKPAVVSPSMLCLDPFPVNPIDKSH